MNPTRIYKTVTDLQTTLADIGATPEILLDGATEVVIDVLNPGSLALADFAIFGKAHPDSAWKLLASATDWNTLGNMIRRVTTVPQSLAVAGQSQLHLIVGPLYSVKFQSKGASGANVVTNGDMGASTGWTLTNATIGAGKATVTAPGDYLLSRSVTLTAGTYTASVDVVTSTGSNTVGIAIVGADGTIICLEEQAASVATFTSAPFTIVTGGSYTLTVFGEEDTALELDNVTCTPSRAAVTILGQIL